MFFGQLALRDVPDVALDGLLIAHVVDVADELDLPVYAVLVLQWQILVANVALFLEFTKGGLALCDVCEQTDLPKASSHELLVGIAQQIAHERIGIFDLPGVGVENEDAVVSALEDPAIAKLGQLQCTFVRHGCVPHLEAVLLNRMHGVFCLDVSFEHGSDGELMPDISPPQRWPPAGTPSLLGSQANPFHQAAETGFRDSDPRAVLGRIGVALLITGFRDALS